MTVSRPSSSDLHMRVVVHIHTVNKYDRQTDRSLPGGADMGVGVGVGSRDRRKTGQVRWAVRSGVLGTGDPGSLGRLPGGKLGRDPRRGLPEQG